MSSNSLNYCYSVVVKTNKEHKVRAICLTEEQARTCMLILNNELYEQDIYGSVIINKVLLNDTTVLIYDEEYIAHINNYDEEDEEDEE